MGWLQPAFLRRWPQPPFVPRYWWAVFRDRATDRLTWAYATPYDHEWEARMSAAKCIFLADLSRETVEVVRLTRAELAEELKEEER